ncbi:MAG: EamA family transporter RarD [Coleofasciculaceae cyanobacterium SM2_1_6]|nr:EamA family transporter RarD [Coleofasciculaceae cyanobacterium SM2_1_6]
MNKPTSELSDLAPDPTSSSLTDNLANPLNPARTGAIYALLAYGAWGLFPIYWKFFGQISPVEVLSHRILWSMVLLTVILVLQQRGAEFRELVRSPKSLGALFLTTTLLTCNWGLYIYGINSDRVLETSLGYFINPLVNVLLGFVFLKERLHLGQKVAVFLATVGVMSFIGNFGQVPWIALGLGFSFAFYGLVRKVVAVAPMVGLAVETLLATPIALMIIGYGAVTGTGHWGSSWWLTILFIGCGVVTSLPLLWFNNAAKRLRLSTMGFFQYLAPTIQLGLGVFIYREPFTLNHGITFGFIWAALAIYSATSLRQQRG